MHEELVSKAMVTFGIGCYKHGLLTYLRHSLEISICTVEELVKRVNEVSASIGLCEQEKGEVEVKALLLWREEHLTLRLYVDLAIRILMTLAEAKGKSTRNPILMTGEFEVLETKRVRLLACW